MPDHHDKAPVLSEPVLIPCVFCEGVEVDTRDTFVRLTGWVLLPAHGHGQVERRNAAHVAMPNTAFRRLLSVGRRKLAKGGH